MRRWLSERVADRIRNASGGHARLVGTRSESQRVSWDDAVAYIEHPSHTLGRQASPHSPPPQAHP
jgi:hypothetical protein